MSHDLQLLIFHVKSFRSQTEHFENLHKADSKLQILWFLISSVLYMHTKSERQQRLFRRKESLTTHSMEQASTIYLRYVPNTNSTPSKMPLRRKAASM